MVQIEYRPSPYGIQTLLTLELLDTLPVPPSPSMLGEDESYEPEESLNANRRFMLSYHPTTRTVDFLVLRSRYESSLEACHVGRRVTVLFFSGKVLLPRPLPTRFLFSLGLKSHRLCSASPHIGGRRLVQEVDHHHRFRAPGRMVLGHRALGVAPVTGHLSRQQVGLPRGGLGRRTGRTRRHGGRHPSVALGVEGVPLR